MCKWLITIPYVRDKPFGFRCLRKCSKINSKLHLILWMIHINSRKDSLKWIWPSFFNTWSTDDNWKSEILSLYISFPEFYKACYPWELGEDQPFNILWKVTHIMRQTTSAHNSNTLISRNLEIGDRKIARITASRVHRVTTYSRN